MSSGDVYGAVSADESTEHGRSGRSLPAGDDSRSAISGDIPEIFLLNYLCSKAFPPGNDSEEANIESENSWERVREWLRSHPAIEVKVAAEQRGENNMTALHMACKNGPPLDVIEVFLSIAGETALWPDNFGWLPLHHACCSYTSFDVIKRLAFAFPETKTAVDRRGKTPLILAIGIIGNNPDLVAILSSTGAAAIPDDHGMLPLHYAAATGASEETLLVLTHAHPDAIHTRDMRNRTPLHFALSNAGRHASPGAVRHLLNLDPDLVNGVGGSPLPLRVLSEYANTLGQGSAEEEEYRDNVFKCLKYVLDADPNPTAVFFTALQGLPNWLSDRAVVIPAVQLLLNEKISQRFPSAVLMLDFYFLIIVIVAYSFNVTDAINERFDGDEKKGIGGVLLILQYVSIAYFIVRDLVQMISLVSLKALNVWFKAASNWLNVVFIILVLTMSILMNTGAGNDLKFRTAAAFTVISIWLKVFVYLRNVSVDFAVFVGGVFYIARRLVAFLVCLGIILIAFAQMFRTVFQQTALCVASERYRPIEYVQCEEATDGSFPYCYAWPAFLNVYTMLLGEVNETYFTSDLFATILFVLFMFLVVILLANVLIAIVTDSYKVIQDQRAAIVFWTNRLDFVAAMDAIANGPWKRRMKKTVGLSGDESPDQDREPESSTGSDLWKRIVYLFEDDLEGGVLTLEFWVIVALRIVTAVIIVPCWLAIGIVTCGWLWPPEIREAIFTSDVSKHSSESAEQDDLRKTQVANLKEEVKDLVIDFDKELAMGRTQIVEIKSSIAGRKADISGEMKHIKRIIATLFEQQSNFDA